MRFIASAPAFPISPRNGAFRLGLRRSKKCTTRCSIAPNDSLFPAITTLKQFAAQEASRAANSSGERKRLGRLAAQESRDFELIFLILLAEDRAR
ncbi:MAG: hypothetical protein WAW96_12635, partial [Alphaproteobacteria bacterium]